MKESEAGKETEAGTVYLVGAGPGDPGLLTVKGAELLARAGAVVFDALSNPVLLERVPAAAERFDVGKRAGRPSPRQRDVSGLLVELARRHRTVVRLKGGDPFVFGRGGEEAITLAEAGIPFEVVPGVTSGVGALSYAGIPLTHRGVSCSATFVTGHRGGPEECGAGGAPLAPMDGTIVVFMGLSRVAEVAAELVERGRSATTPTAVVNRGTLPDQRTVVGTLANIAERVQSAGLEGPALIVVGDVVGLRSRVAWFEEGGTSRGGATAREDEERAASRKQPAAQQGHAAVEEQHEEPVQEQDPAAVEEDERRSDGPFRRAREPALASTTAWVRDHHPTGDRR